MKHVRPLFVLLLFILASCQRHGSLLSDFKPYEGNIVELGSQVDSSDLGLVEGLHCNDSTFVILDFHHNKSYSLFGLDKKRIVKRFGEIGNGHLEIPIGCVGNIYKDKFVVFDDERSIIATYTLSLDSTLVKCVSVHKYKIPDAQFTKIVPAEDGLFIGMGSYKDKYQYVLFNDQNKVLDYSYELYNANDDEFNTYQKFLSNQGKLARHPKKMLFAGVVRYSSNMDIFKVDGGKIKNIKSFRMQNPSYTTMQMMGLSRVVPQDDAINGFLDICATEKYILALYSDEKIRVSPYHSKTILVFDWDGNKICRIDMPNDAFYISANGNNIYTAEKEDKGKYIIKGYKIKLNQN